MDINVIYYYDLIGNNKTGQALEELQASLPKFHKELALIKNRFYSIHQQKNLGTVTFENTQVTIAQINSSILAFLDRLQKGDKEADKCLVPNPPVDSPISELINNQLKHAKNTIHENKAFRTAVGVLFLLAVFFSTIIGFRHFSFLNEGLKIMSLLATNILLYISIGILALYALSLIIRGSLFNQNHLNFYQKILKK